MEANTWATRSDQTRGTAAAVSSAEQNPVQMNPRNTLAIPKPKITGKRGTTNTFANAETRETCPKAINETGAVPTVAARETAAHEAINQGSRCSARSKGRASASTPATAAKES